jgi:sigma-E factor negative regulatory protein RseA
MDRISALMDGELDKAQQRQELDHLRHDTELRERWELFHLIGDVLRGERMLSPEFSRRIAQRLADEPTVLAPRRISFGRKAARYALSAAATLAAVALVAWVALTPGGLNAPREVAQAPVPVPAAAVPAAPAVNPITPYVTAIVPSEGAMNDYILAHQGFSPSTAIQGVVPYIRGVSAGQPPAKR